MLNPEDNDMAWLQNRHCKQAWTCKQLTDLHCAPAGFIIQRWRHNINQHAIRRQARPEGEEVAAVCHHNAHHVPVELLLCEPKGQRAPPATGHGSNTVRIYVTRGKAHESTTAGLYSSLLTQTGAEQFKVEEAWRNHLWGLNLALSNNVTHRYCLGISFSEEQLSTIKVVIQIENGTVRQTY